MEIADEQGQARTLRHITVKLRQPTRDGDLELQILTNLTPGEASAAKIADLYANRWTIEVVFLEMQQTLTCEINTLGYPKAALFAFCIALLVTNAVSMLKESLRAVHGVKTIDEKVSPYYLSLEIQKTYDGMMVQIPAAPLECVCQHDPRTVHQDPAGTGTQSRTVALSQNQTRSQKPPPKRGCYHNGGHISTFKVLAKRKTKQ